MYVYNILWPHKEDIWAGYGKKETQPSHSLQMESLRHFWVRLKMELGQG